MNLLLFNLKTDVDDDILGFTTDWINSLAPHFKKVYVVTMQAGRIAVADNVVVYSVGKEQGYSEPRRLLEFYKIIYTLLSKEKIDVCFAHMIPLFAVLGWPLLRWKRIPIMLWYAHGHVPWMLRIAEKIVNIIVTPNKYSCRLNSNKLNIVGHGINLDKNAFSLKKKEKKDKINLLYVGRISPVKNVHLLIDSLLLWEKKLNQKKLWLRIVGGPLGKDDIAYYNKVLKKVKDNNLEYYVTFHGPKPYNEVMEYYKNCDVFINPSNTGSVDKTVLEAMANGSLVITSNEAFNTIDYKDAGGFFTLNSSEGICCTLEEISRLTETEIVNILKKGRCWVKNNHSLEVLAYKLASKLKALCYNRG